MADTSALGDRMKAHENVTRFVLPQRTYTLIRVDGRAFHSLLRRAEKPFDHDFMKIMTYVAVALCQEIAGSAFAYLQSDEVSVLATDFGSVHSEPWFGGTVQKIASIAASVATVEFNYRVSMCGDKLPNSIATFDARVFTIPEPVEVANYFLWRQRDAKRNSISMAAQAHFPHKSLHGLNGDQVQEKLFTERGVNWNDYPDQAKRGNVCIRKAVSVTRSRWECEPAPYFAARPESWLAGMIPPLPTLT